MSRHVCFAKMSLSVIVGSIGVGLVLLAFFLNLFKLLDRDTLLYVVMNIIGGGMSCVASLMINYIPFVILEGAWFLVSVGGLIFILKK